jgi:4'-phosphopantetheinyl transferase
VPRVAGSPGAERSPAGLASDRWPRGPHAPFLGAGALHVWRLELDRPPDEIERLGSLLSAGERSRAARFRFPRDRDRHVVAHGALRIVVGRYLRLHPSAIAFRVGPHGKPALTEDPPNLHFNLSHSGDLALIALSGEAPVGVDVEHTRRDPDLEALARRFFSPAEQQALAALPPGERVKGFYQCWTRKEAVIKATGEGLSRPLDSFDVSLGSARPRLLRLDGDPTAADFWSLAELQPGRDYLGAVATRKPSVRLVLCDFG